MTPEEARKQLKILLAHARYAEGQSLARQIRDEAIRDKNSELAADATFVLGQCCFEELHYQDAWDAFADVLADFSELYGPSHLRTTRARAWLSCVSMFLERKEEARSLLERAKSAIPATPAEDERSIAADALRAIGFVENRLNDTKSAITHLERSLELIELAKDADELDIADICVTLALVELVVVNLERAKTLNERALEIRKRHLGDENPLVTDCRKNLDMVQMILDDPKNLVPMLESSLPTDQPHASRGLISASEQDHSRAIDTLEKALLTNGGEDADTPEVAQTLIMMGLMQLGFDKPDLAEPHLRRAVKILLPLHQTEQETLFKAFSNTLMALNAQRKFREVISFVEPIMEKMQKEVVVDASFLAATIAGLSTGYYGLKKYAKSEKLLRRAIGVIESRLGPNARELEPLLQNLSQLLEEMGRKAEARTFAKRSEEIQARYA